MKSLRKTGTILFCVIGILQGHAPAIAMDATDAPESVTLDYLQELYEAVHFDHQLHTDMYQCNFCHHHTTGDTPLKESCRSCHDATHAVVDVSCSGCHATQPTPHQSANESAHSVYHIDTPDFKGAMHLQCLGCHTVESGPTGCRDCHAFTPAGRKRFALKEENQALADFASTIKSSTTEKITEGE